MLKRIFLILCFFLSFQLYAQKAEMKADVLYDEFLCNLLKTSDRLYIAGYPDDYLINKSPLSHFKGYESLYSDDPSIVIIHGQSFGVPIGAEGNSEKEYEAIWVLLNSRLYLCKIHFSIGKRDDKIVYPPMEKLTGKRFKRKNIPDINIPASIYGLMSATWFTDTLYVKKANSGKKPLNEWQEKQYMRMIFNEGKLVTTKVITNKTWIQTITLPPH